MPKGASAFRPKWRCMKLPHLAKIRKGFFKGQENAWPGPPLKNTPKKRQHSIISVPFVHIFSDSQNMFLGLLHSEAQIQLNNLPNPGSP